jgi:hypothetical protein
VPLVKDAAMIGNGRSVASAMRAPSSAQAIASTNCPNSARLLVNAQRESTGMLK